MTTDFLIRIVVATLLGGIIGLERGYRAKEAGFRTHFLVALGSALFMILSAHGFDDVSFTENHRLDVSRIAAQVVSGIGFIGAGTIIFQRHAVHGLTTAAGLWVTAAIGMSAGAGLFVIAVTATILVLIGLEALNSLLPHIGHRNIIVTFSVRERETVQHLLTKLKADGIVIVSFAMNEDTAQPFAAKPPPQHHTVKMEIKMTRSQYSDEILQLMTATDGVEVESIE